MIIADGSHEIHRVFIGDVEVSREFMEGGQAFHNFSGSTNPYLVIERGATRRDPDFDKPRDWQAGWAYAWREHSRDRLARLTAAPRFPSPA